MADTNHAKRRTDIMHDKAVEVTHKNSDSIPIDTTQLVLESVPPPYTAYPAKFERPSELELYANFNSSKCPCPSSTKVLKKEHLFQGTTRPSAF